MRHDEVEMRLEELCRESHSGTLVLRVRNLARTLVQEGYSREDLLKVFENHRAVLQGRGSEDLEDDLLDVADLLDGWCAEHAKI